MLKQILDSVLSVVPDGHTGSDDIQDEVEASQ